MQDNTPSSGTNSNSDGLTPEQTPDLFKVMSEAYHTASGSKAPADIPTLEQLETKKEQAPPIAEPENKLAETPPEVDTKGKETPQQTPDNPYAWVDGISDDDLKAKIGQILHERKEIQHKYDSDRPRLQYARKAVDELKRELAELKSQKQAQTTPQTRSAAAPKIDIPEDPEWNSLVEEDPRFTKALERRAEQIVEARLSQLAPELSKIAEEQARATVAPFEQDRAVQHFQNEMARLHQAVPNLNEVVESTQYKDWLEYHASPLVRDLASNADTFDKAIHVLKAYDYDMRMRSGGFSPTAAQATKPTSTVDTSVADRLAKEREEKAAKTVAQTPARQATPVGSAATKAPPTLDQLKKIMEAAYNKG